MENDWTLDDWCWWLSMQIVWIFKQRYRLRCRNTTSIYWNIQIENCDILMQICALLFICKMVPFNLTHFLKVAVRKIEERRVVMRKSRSFICFSFNPSLNVDCDQWCAVLTDIISDMSTVCMPHINLTVVVYLLWITFVFCYAQQQDVRRYISLEMVVASHLLVGFPNAISVSKVPSFDMCVTWKCDIE